jgi:hypothetical protein
MILLPLAFLAVVNDYWLLAFILLMIWLHRD